MPTWLDRDNGVRALLVVFALSNFGYFLLDPLEPRFYPWLALYSIQFLLLAGIVALRPSRLGEVIVAAVASRIVLWFTAPVLEADFYRYLWDGHVWAHGINPYLYPPEHAALDDLETGYRFFITHSQFSTIYPPLAQVVFRVSHALAPDSLFGLKVLLTLFDLGTGLVLIKWLGERAQVLPGAALYLLNPLVLKEIANSAHVDAVAVFFATASLYAFCRSGPPRFASSIGWVLLSLSTASKLYASVYLPLLFRCDPKRWRHLAVAAVTLVLLYVPFLGAGSQLFSGTAAFGQFWIFNASLFRAVSWLSAFVAPGNLLAPRVAVGLIFTAIVVDRARRTTVRSDVPHAALVVTGALLLLSPVVDAWYVLWILPLAIVTRSAPWLAFTYLVAFSYAWFESPELAGLFQIVEYVSLFTIMGLLWLPTTTKVKS